MPPARIAHFAREPQLSRPAPIPQEKDIGGFGVGIGAAGAGFGLGSWGLLPGSTGIAVTPLSATGISTAWACVRRVAQDMGKLPRRVMQELPRGGAKVLRDHPLRKLFREPNYWQNPSQFWAYVAGWYCLRGNAYIMVLRDGAGQPTALIPLSPDRCSVMLSPKGEIYYRVSHPTFRSGESFVMHRDNIMHLRTEISFDGYTGVSPIAAGPDVFGVAIAAQQHAAVMFRQGARPSGVIKHPKKINPEGRAFLRQEWNQVYSGVQNAFQTAVLDEGMMFEPLSMNNEDAQLLESRQFSVVEVCRMFGVPPHKVMDLSRAHFANVESLNLDYKGDTLQPIDQQLCEELARTLLYTDERDAGIYVATDFDELLKADRKTRYETDEIGIRSGRLTQNEARIGDGREPNVPGGDEYQKPLNMGTSGEGDGKGKPDDKPDPTIAQDETESGSEGEGSSEA